MFAPIFWQAWLRGRGGTGSVFTADTAAQEFGVVKSSYVPVQLLSRDVHKVLRVDEG